MPEWDEPACCRRCGVPTPGGGVAGYCPDCARELVAHIKKVVPPADNRARVTPAPRRSAGVPAAGGFLYTTRERCPVCGTTFSATRVAMSRLRIEAREADFYVRYVPLDPNLYQVWVCPACGYSAAQGAFAPLFPDERERAAAAGLSLRERGAGVLNDIPDLQPGDAEPARAEPPVHPGAATSLGPGEGSAGPGQDGGGAPLARPLAEVLADYRRALYFARCRRRAHGIAGGLYLRLAWIYRARGDAEQDRRLSALALDEYLQAYEREDGLPGNMDEFGAAYLIGVLSMRMGRLRDAARYLGQVVSARSGADPAIRKMAQDQWYELQQVWERSQSCPTPGAPESQPESQ